MTSDLSLGGGVLELAVERFSHGQSPLRIQQPPCPIHTPDNTPHAALAIHLLYGFSLQHPRRETTRRMLQPHASCTPTAHQHHRCNTTPHNAWLSRSFSDQSSPRTLTPRRDHLASSTPTVPHHHHRWQVSSPPHEPLSFTAADPTKRASNYVPLRVHRATVAPTPSYVERVVHVAGCSEDGLCHSAVALHARGHTRVQWDGA
jgi:hypothetical protein